MFGQSVSMCITTKNVFLFELIGIFFISGVSFAHLNVRETNKKEKLIFGDDSH
jgi:hypothetical protein